MKICRRAAVFWDLPDQNRNAGTHSAEIWLAKLCKRLPESIGWQKQKSNDNFEV